MPSLRVSAGSAANDVQHACAVLMLQCAQRSKVPIVRVRRLQQHSAARQWASLQECGMLCVHRTTPALTQHSATLKQRHTVHLSIGHSVPVEASRPLQLGGSILTETFRLQRMHCRTKRAQCAERAGG